LECTGSPRSCASDRWSFESGGLEGFQVLSTGTVSDAVDGVSIVTTRAVDGTHSLAVQATFDCNRRSVIVGIYPCGVGTSANLKGRTLKFQVYLEGPALQGDHQASAILLSGSAATADIPVVVGQWTPASLILTSPSDASTQGFEYSLYMLPHGPPPGNVCLTWPGSIYLDAFSIE